MLVWLAVLVLIALSGFALAACGDDDDDGDGNGAVATEPDGGGEGGLLQEAIDRGFITVGIANEAPYGFEDEGGAATGEAPEIAKEVLARLGITEIRSVVVEFGSLIPGLNAGQFDMIAAGMFIRPDRAEQILFSDPDYCATQSFAVAEGNPLGVGTFDDVAANSEINLGILTGGVEADYAEAAGVAEDQITTFDFTANAFEGLIDGRVDAVALTSITVNWEVQQSEQEGIEATEGFVPVIDGVEQFGCGGFGFRFENQEFRDAFNDVLNEMKANDEILPIVEQFGFTAADIDQAKDVTVEDLTAPAAEE